MNWPLYFEFLAKIGRGLARVGSVISKLKMLLVGLFSSIVIFIATAIVAHIYGFNIQKANVLLFIAVISIPFGFCLALIQERNDMNARGRDDDDRSMSM